MTSGVLVERYQFLAQVRDGVVEWTVAVETQGGVQHVLPLKDGEEVPILADFLRRDRTMYFDPETRTLRTGWNPAGDGVK